MTNDTIKIFTIGFTGTTAEHFFGRLSHANVNNVIDTRLWADTQLAGFAKKKNMPYFLESLVGAKYEHQTNLAPTEDILKGFKSKNMSWNEYESRYLNLMQSRQIANSLTPDKVNGACFLCSEQKPHFCHRRLLAEYLQNVWSRPIEIVHL